MASDPRYSPIAGQIGGHSPAPIVNILDSRGQTQNMAILGMLTLQFLVVALIAWQLILPTSSQTKEEKEKLTAIEEKIDSVNQSQLAAARLKGQAQSRRDILLALTENKDLSDEYENTLERLSLEQQKSTALANNGVRLESKLSTSRLNAASWKKKHGKVTDTLEIMKGKHDKQKSRADDFEEELDELEKNGGIRPFWRDWKSWLVGTVIAIIGLVGGYMAAVSFRREDDGDFEDDNQDFEFRADDGAANAESSEPENDEPDDKEIIT